MKHVTNAMVYVSAVYTFNDKRKIYIRQGISIQILRKT